MAITMTDEDTPRLEIIIALDEDDPFGMHTFLRELPWFGVVGGWDNFEATVVESDGAVRDAKREAYEGEDPYYTDGADD